MNKNDPINNGHKALPSMLITILWDIEKVTIIPSLEKKEGEGFELPF